MLQFLRRIFRQHKTTGAVVVRRQLSSRTKLLVFGGVATAIVVASILLYEQGLSMAGFERGVATQTQQRLQDQNKQVEDDNRQLRESLARAERTIQMDQAAYQDLDKALQNSAQEIVKLREELNFYRNIISPADKKGGLRIQSLDIQPAGSTNLFRYKLVLIQALKHDHGIFGTANIELSGSQGGQDIAIKIPPAGDKPIQVNLKYFQDIEGKFELPRGFRPRSVKVNVNVAGGGQTVEASYDWPQAYAAGKND